MRALDAWGRVFAIFGAVVIAALFLGAHGLVHVYDTLRGALGTRIGGSTCPACTCLRW